MRAKLDIESGPGVVTPARQLGQEWWQCLSLYALTLGTRCGGGWSGRVVPQGTRARGDTASGADWISSKKLPAFQQRFYGRA